MRLVKTIFLTALVAAVAVGCGKKDDSDDAGGGGGGGAGSASVYGFLAGDGGDGIGNAKVVLHTTGDEVSTGADGSFVFNDVPDGDLVFEFRAEGHAEATRRILVEDHKPHSLWMQLKPLTAPKTITLPAAGDDPIKVTGPRERMNLIIAAGSVADADDTATALAAGTEIQVSITPFDAADDLETLPADLLTYPENEGDAPAPLFTYGMAYFKLTQGEKNLEVTEGSAIKWESEIPEARRDFVAEAEPALYYLKYADGLWLREEDSPKVIDEDNWKVTLDMPRLTDPNVDAPPPPPTGCVKVAVTFRGHTPNRAVQISMPDSTGRSGNCFNYVCAGNQNRGRVRAHVWGNLWVERSFGGPCDNRRCPNCPQRDIDLDGPDWECPDDSKYITCAGDGDCCLGMVCEDKMCVVRGD